MDTTTALPVSAISPDPGQPRRRFDEAALEELAASISSVGLVEPIIVRPAGDRFVIIAGERRYRAHVRLGLATIPAIVRPDLEGVDAFVVQMIENVIRADMDPVEEAHGYRRLIDAGLTEAEVAERIGVSLTNVHYRLALLRLDAPILKLVADGQLGVRDGWIMSRLSIEGQHRVIRAMVAGQLAKPGDIARMVEIVHRDENQTSMFSEAEAPVIDVKATRQSRDRLERTLALLSDLLEETDATMVDDRMAEQAAEVKRAAARLADRFAARRVAVAVQQQEVMA